MPWYLEEKYSQQMTLLKAESPGLNIVAQPGWAQCWPCAPGTRGSAGQGVFVYEVLKRSYGMKFKTSLPSRQRKWTPIYSKYFFLVTVKRTPDRKKRAICSYSPIVDDPKKCSGHNGTLLTRWAWGSSCGWLESRLYHSLAGFLLTFQA